MWIWSELIGHGSTKWLLIGCLITLYALMVKGQQGGHGSDCNTASDCQLEFICRSKKCVCDSSHLYDIAKNICKKICRGSSEGMVKHGTFDHQYKLYKNKYTNCSFVDGNLELTNLEKNYDFGFLKDIEEVDGYVLIVNIHSHYLNLTNLRIIRGKTLFHNKNQSYSLYVALNQNPINEYDGLLELQFKSLSEIVTGKVYFHNNNLLCFVNTIRWDDINTSTRPSFEIVSHPVGYTRTCPSCHKDCYNADTQHSHCWGSGKDMCQKLNYVKEVCSPTCDGRCFDKEQNTCCHPECAAGCTGPRKTECWACKNFYNEGACYPYCPQIRMYDTTLLKMVDNPLGRYSFGSLCVKDCPPYLLKDGNACVIKCPEGTRPVKNVCEDCKGTCPKTCPGINDDDQFLHSGNIGQFKGCTLVDGSLKILKVTFDGDKHQNIAGISVKDLDILKDIKEITGYLSIQELPDEVKSLSFLSGLEMISGRNLLSGYALSVLKMKIEYIGLTTLRNISNGNVMIAINDRLCFTQTLDLKPIFSNSRQVQIVKRNRNSTECDARGLKCHSECSKHGCWGPGPDKCLMCPNVRIEHNNTCLANCNDRPLLYLKENSSTCLQCDPQCAEGCSGPGPDHCTKCKKVVVIGEVNNDTRKVCMEKCPPVSEAMKIFQYPDENRVCRPCNTSCSEGCTGPSSAVITGGCNTCDLAINRTRENDTVHCLPKNWETCPDGFYIQQFSSIVAHPLAKKQVCQPCDRLCLTCHGSGNSNCPLCRHYLHKSSKHYSMCVETCPPYTFPSIEGECLDCHKQCLSDCYGPNATHCRSCRQFKILNKDNEYSGEFECVEKCPDHLPHLVTDPDPSKPVATVCANDEHPEVVAAAQQTKDEERKKILTIALPVCAGVLLLGVLLVVFGYCWRQRERAKENTVKLTARMTGVVEAEPLTPTDAKPDLSKLRLIKESELRRGGIIGSGAFGTVYKGFWIPEGENIKVPVAVKVLQEGTSPNQNQELLEEARVMTSVEHPCCIRILAVCMASQMMLITQLMPLGCLLDYIRKHKDNTGSKSLLNWCTQIARGMGYLEDRGIVHRDLAARNVLVQSAGQVKITDFGLAKLLDYNEPEYHAAGGKMPIKWLALECIQHRIFTHKSDVWSYGVTVWELFTYGNRPYENVRARDVPDLLEKGERLPQPPICTIDVYMIMIKCWMLDADSRPAFNELAEEFAKMARDPGRYLVIQGDALKKIPSEEILVGSRTDLLLENGVEEGDKLMRLPSYSYDKDDLARHLSVAADGPEEVVEADDYLQPAPPVPLAADNNNVKNPLLHSSHGASNKETPMLIREKRYGHLESAAAARQQRELSPSRLRGDSINGRYSSDPVKYTRSRDDIDGNVMLRVPAMGNGNIPGYYKPGQQQSDVGIHLPVDEDDYLQPKSANPKAYLDLVDGKDYYLNEKQMCEPLDADNYLVPNPVPSVFDNPEYFEGVDPRDNVFDKKPEQNRSVKPKIAPKPKRLTDYYNDINSMSPTGRDSTLPLLSTSSNCSNGESAV